MRIMKRKAREGRKDGNERNGTEEKECGCEEEAEGEKRD